MKRTPGDWILGGVLLMLAAGAEADQDSAMLELANTRGCFICHRVVPDEAGDTLPLGPSYQEVAVRYRGDTKVFDRLVDRVLHGTAYREQAWEGKVSMRYMPPNVNLARDEAAALVRWILDLEVSPEAAQRLGRHEQMLALANYSGCMICHHLDPVADRRVVPLAPSFREVAAAYEGQPDAEQRLVKAVTEGTMASGSKTWENVNMRFMPPSVNVKKEDAERLVSWILSLDTRAVARRP